MISFYLCVFKSYLLQIRFALMEIFWKESKNLWESRFDLTEAVK